MIPHHLATLIQAIKQVSPELVSNCKYISKDEELIYLEERSFAYELYRQWQNLIEDSYEDLVINAEIPKIVEEEKFKAKLFKIFGLTNDGRIHTCFLPDLVCHHSQFDSENQGVICEIKTIKNIKGSNQENLLKDFKKLASYMTKGVLLKNPFSIGVFILLGGEFSDIAIKLNSLIRNKENDIYCIIYKARRIENEDYGVFIPDVKCMKLSELFKHRCSYEKN